MAGAGWGDRSELPAAGIRLYHFVADGHLSKVGRISTANFAKGPARLALLGLDAKEG